MLQPAGTFQPFACNSLQKGTPVQKYLKELDEKFEEFLQRHMKDYWLQLDDGASSR